MNGMLFEQQKVGANKMHGISAHHVLRTSLDHDI
jgi:hypothetical protein